MKERSFTLLPAPKAGESMQVRFAGRTLPLKAVMEAFFRAWERDKENRLKELIFRIPSHIRTEKNGLSHTQDLNDCLTNELVYRILKMPKTGTRRSFVEAFNERMEECFGGEDGRDLISFDPLDQDLVEWAQKKGYYIEFDELEIVDGACREAG